MLNKIHFLVISILLLFFIGCSPKIVKYEYNKKLMGYTVTVKRGLGVKVKYLARDKSGKKIETEEEIKNYVSEHKENPIGYKPYTKWTPSESNKYKMAELYYSGLRAFQNGKYPEAIEFFKKSIAFDEDIRKYTDIYYLIAVSYDKLNDKESAKKYFKNFIDYSESIIHPNFYYRFNDSDNKKIYSLLLEAKNYIDNKNTKSDSLALKYHKETYFAKYRSRGYKPGFVLGNSGIEGMFIVGMVYDSIYGFGGYIEVYGGIFNGIDIDIYYAYLQYLSQFYISVPLSIYRDRHHRLGIKFTPAFYYNLRSIDIDVFNNNRKSGSLINISGSLSIGYNITHYWLVYSGYKYYYYNQDNPYISTSLVSMWNDNRFYIGSTLYLLGDLGITVEYNYKDFLAYCELRYFGVGYNISSKKVYMRLIKDYY